MYFWLFPETGFKAKAIEVIDGSKRSGHSCLFHRIGKFRRIVLYDTLIEQMEIEEIEAFSLTRSVTTSWDTYRKDLRYLSFLVWAVFFCFPTFCKVLVLRRVCLDLL